MTVILRKGNPKTNEPHVFKCTFCSTIFKTDEYRIKPDHHNGTFFIAVCPICNRMKAYEDENKE